MNEITPLIFSKKFSDARGWFVNGNVFFHFIFVMAMHVHDLFSKLSEVFAIEKRQNLYIHAMGSFVEGRFLFSRLGQMERF